MDNGEIPFHKVLIADHDEHDVHQSFSTLTLVFWSYPETFRGSTILVSQLILQNAPTTSLGLEYAVMVMGTFSDVGIIDVTISPDNLNNIQALDRLTKSRETRNGFAAIRTLVASQLMRIY